jgi:dihydrofolate reductase
MTRRSSAGDGDNSARRTGMRKIFATEFLTLDGVMEAPHHWSFQFWSDETTKFKLDELFASDALLLGRVTYEGFAEAWPSRTDEEGFAERMNGLPKYVVSTTLDEVAWNNSHLIKGDVAKEVAALKQQPGQDIAIHGSAGLVRSLMQHGLIDEYRLMVFPVVVGKGKRLFHDEGDKTVLKLVESKTFASGVVVLTYEPAEQVEQG